MQHLHSSTFILPYCYFHISENSPFALFSYRDQVQILLRLALLVHRTPGSTARVSTRGTCSSAWRTTSSPGTLLPSTKVICRIDVKEMQGWELKCVERASTCYIERAKDALITEERRAATWHVSRSFGYAEHKCEMRW